MSTDPYHASALSWQVVALTNQLERERDELRAENKRLRAALEWIESVQCIDACHHVPVMKRKAAEALEHRLNERLRERDLEMLIEYDRQRKEAERLWAALEQIATGPMDVWGAREVATAALADHKECR